MPVPAAYKYESPNQDGAIAGHRPRVSVGIVNNMPDAALQATERQLVTLLQAASGATDIRIHLFTLPGIPRTGAAKDRIESRYIDYTELSHLHMDGMLVTGAVPGSSCISNESFWGEFTQLVDWASVHTISTIWSCLAAHAAVLHLDGIKRHPLHKKLSGVYQAEVCCDATLLAGLAPNYCVPHSRYNELAERELVDAGYAILGRSTDAGVDIFAKDTPSRFIFLQGHPEYDSDTLLREYRRDVAQFLSGQRPDHPVLPAGYFPDELERRLTVLADMAVADRDPGILAHYVDLQTNVSAISAWSIYATRLFSAWIADIANRKSAQSRRPKVAA